VIGNNSKRNTIKRNDTVTTNDEPRKPQVSLATKISEKMLLLKQRYVLMFISPSLYIATYGVLDFIMGYIAIVLIFAGIMSLLLK
jgi:hypothetical protein